MSEQETMTSRERALRTLRHEPVDRAPRDLWALQGVVMFRKDEFQAMHKRFPGDFDKPPSAYPTWRGTGGPTGQPNERRDDWGCVWRVQQAGLAGEVRHSPLADWSALRTFRPPEGKLACADFSAVNRFCAETDVFVRPGTETRPFERYQFLRGVEAGLADLAYGTKEAMSLLAMLHDFFCREMELWATSDVDGVGFMDDWGTQTSLLISPAMWREIFKPMYKDYCDILHRKGKYVFFHSDGFIESIYPDLVEIGIDAVNSQLFCMDIESLAERFRGKITFWGEIDRQKVLPFGTPEDVRQAVQRVRKALDRGQGGLIAQCEWGLNDPFDNVAAVFDEWAKPLESV